MLILLLCPAGDPVDVVYNLYQAINKHTEHQASYVVGDKSNEVIRELMVKADVIHYNQEFTHLDLIPHNKKVVFHGHGGAWLLAPDSYIAIAKGLNATMVTCSPIDEVVVPGIKWIPNILDMSDPALIPDFGKDYSGKLIASMAQHCPVYKGGEITRYVFEYLRKFGYNVDFQIISNLSRTAAFNIRRNHHFTIDNWTQGFFGMAGLEGLALGHITFCRFDYLTLRKWQDSFGDIPISDIHGMDECAKRVREYYNDRDMLLEHSKGNRLWMENNYTPAQVVKLWIDFYESL